ncbi:MAG: hypothetical protein LBK26_03060 [Rickettsiales bacterium]|nr:hypothetical protein [Rickettsiales bacterium]
MKTKIIYISGGEVFPPSQVRGAFDAVRNMLNLDSDTIIFGVPVDSDDVGAADTPKFAVAVDNISADMAEIIKEEPVEEKYDFLSESLEITEIAEKPKRVRKKKESSEKLTDNAPALTSEDKPVAPILSIIGAINSETVSQVVPDVAQEEPMIVVESESDFAGVQDFSDDADDDEIKSIEDIFADIAPLSEDRPVDLTEYVQPEETVSAPAAESSDTETDATLSKLATEFAATQDGDDSQEILPAKGGRIGKLKNILPFKKKEKAESSVLGDLFGWAGVAANDDAAEFAMPEFFRMSN